MVDEELERGLRSVAVPILDRAGQALGALNISTHSTRTTRNEMREQFCRRCARRPRRSRRSPYECGAPACWSGADRDAGCSTSSAARLPRYARGPIV